MIALRQEPLGIWNPVPLSRNANHVTPSERCRRCGCWMSIYRDEWEIRCLPCQLVEPVTAPLTVAGGDRLLEAIAEDVRRVEQLEERAWREAERAARPPRPLSADQ